MKVKKFQAADMPEAMVKVRNELGKSAVILHSREVDTGGFLGFFGKKKLEVIAAADPEAAEMKKQKKRPERPAGETAQREFREKASPPENSESAKTASSAPFRSLSVAAQPGGVSDASAVLEFHGFGKQLTGDIHHAMTSRWYKEDSPAHIDFNLYMKEALEQKVEEGWFRSWEENEVFVFLAGPTGAGKTTTIAKLASEAVLRKGLKTALITADTYRIAAVEQLKTYAGILDIPISVVYSPEDFSEAVEEFRDFDRVYVDTAGRNYHDPAYTAQVKELTSRADSKQVHVVLPLTGKGDDLISIAARFSELEPESVIFSKWDETTSRGAMLRVLNETGLKGSLITTGQEVPEDLAFLTKEKVIEQVIKDGAYGN
ncbi:flagellar biosynthesis protein FlhF [Alteribacter natronophilus]|uniref:flagellar biosynthesis protein FlhF n=1 Tax=Alteribacter natronophilus TaxID=2583810 RepID=UPI00110F432D|nr:flagellar biosynthesis protein FlhF [Alteribacter natronophilus]TMW73230.1 flagellar biosynthesis protein FlhF [Alteribacter natronophilus]